MAEAIAFDLALELITKLSSRALSQVGLCWNVKDDLDDLKSTVSTIKAVLLDAEERSVTSHLVKGWLEKLKDVLYDADDLLDDFSTEALRKDLLGGNKLTKEGFIKQLNQSHSLEEIGFGYFKDLVERSFFQEVEEYRIGNMRCKMHDLMHDLAESVAGMESSIVDSNKIASDVGEKCRHISIAPSLIPLFKGKKLRTLLHFPNNTDQNLSDETWDLIISNCRCLRVLKLNSIGIQKISPSICKLKRLRYLDLSRNFSLKILPKSICKIQNLLALKLDGCDGLKELPKKIEKLVNLTHLECEHCISLTHMPRGIGKLTSLETLSMFVVDKDGSHGGADLSELRLLNNLRGRLEIRNLGFVKNAKEKFEAANLKEKQHLRSLVLEWGGGNHDDEKSLEDLQPHPNLKELCIGGWRGDAKFPSWLSLLTNLVDISIYAPSKFKHLPSFAQLPCLQQLKLSGLTELECMDNNSSKGSQGESESFFPSLKYLRLDNCPNMNSWWRKRSIGDSNEDDTTVMGTSTMAFPCLSSLEIRNCPLTSMPLYPSLDDKLELRNTSSRPLKQTMKMNITSTTPSTSTSSLPLSKLKSFHVHNIEGLDTHPLDECLQHLASLKTLTIGDCKEVDLEGMQWEPLKNLSHLEIDNIPKLVSLPIWLQHLVQLKTLKIHNSNGLRSLLPVFQHLTFLEEFEVTDCKELELSGAGIQIFQDHTSLRSLRLRNIPKCRHLPEWLQHLTNLQRLYLVNLPNLTSLPDEMRCLTKLQTLEIERIPQLEERFRKDIGADWQKIAHIPNIRLYQ
ncbi:putative disease resistance protein RGA1 isoform X2 [Gossypium hirsutum]|uniref:Disease resistance protein RGA1 isoform X2 n=1 Tax=Gossypium hirsutum TaxID=3635 RepID=A0ABM3B245_GOSHI|nr:putative disease resistance protein RGA1 isoform X2 [Gossypium hirsutum]XP_040961119.1 putative disease resistance protein RGA1 isoform X2 [Gossypium hirsutum]